MPEETLIAYSFKELAELMVKDSGKHEGYWGVYARFGMQAANVGPTDSDIKPSAIIPIIEIGLQKVDAVTNLSVDAAQVNPKPTGGKSGRKLIGA